MHRLVLWDIWFVEVAQESEEWKAWATMFVHVNNYN